MSANPLFFVWSRRVRDVSHLLRLGFHAVELGLILRRIILGRELGDLRLDVSDPVRGLRMGRQERRKLAGVLLPAASSF